MAGGLKLGPTAAASQGEEAKRGQCQVPKKFAPVLAGKASREESLDPNPPQPPFIKAIIQNLT